ncbi:MAG: ribonuclease PH, partial [Spirochaetaceae bacterium]|nr:ribonuclease PH [Spirochaetaceae bacterium]
EALSMIAGQQGRPGPGYYLLGQIAAVSVGIVDGQIVCDLDYENDSQAEVDMNVVKRDDNLVEVQGTGEKGTFTRAQLLELLDAADEGIAEILEAQRQVLGA